MESESDVVFTTSWEDEEEEEDIMFSPAFMARRASESWIDTPPLEVSKMRIFM